MKICKVDEDDRQRISTELEKCSHPLDIESGVLYNIHNGQGSSDGQCVRLLGTWWDDGNYIPQLTPNRIPCKIQFASEHLKRCGRIGNKVVFDLESIFLHLLVVGQQREMELLSIFGYELCAVPPSLMDEYGCLRRRNKAILVHKLRVKHHKPPRPDVIIVDVEQLLYHVVWHCGDVRVCWRSH